MKTLNHTLTFFLLFWTISTPAQLKWDGAMDGDGDGFSWNDPLNWNLDRLPTPEEDVLLDQSLHPFSYEVVLPSGNASVSVSHLRIQPRSGSGILLTLPISNTASPGFMATGTGDALILDSGAIFLNISGAASGTPVMVGTDNFLRINNGGRYIHRTPRGHTNNFVTRLSQAPGTENGIFEFDVPGSPGTSYVVSGSGRTFGSLWLNGFAAGGNKTYVTSGGNRLLVKGDMILQKGADYTHNIQNILGVEGRLHIDTGSVMNLSANTYPTELLLGGDLRIDGSLVETGTGRPGIFFKGFNPQHVRVASSQGLQGDSLWLKLDNPQGLVLDRPLQVPFSFSFSNGNLVSFPEAPLIFPPGSYWDGASNQSHVNGPVQRIGKVDFLFPVGEGGQYAPVRLQGNPAAGAGETWQAAYHRQDPRQMTGGSLPSSLSHISQVEYWDIRPLLDSSSRLIELYVGETSFANDSNALRVAGRGSEEQWADLGNGGFQSYSLNPLTGMLRSTVAIHAGGYFTLGSSDGSPINPLPLHFVDCGLSEREGRNRITWETGDIPEPGTWFEIERSLNGSDFQVLARVEGEAKRIYNWQDSLWMPDDHLSGELDFDPVLTYRVRLHQPNGLTELSQVMRQRMKMDKRAGVKLYPNPFREHGTLELHARNKGRVEVQVFDRCGRIRKRFFLDLKKGWNQCPFRISGMEKGWYCIRIKSPVDQYPEIPVISR